MGEKFQVGLMLGQKHVSRMEILSSSHSGSDLIVRIGDIILSPSPKLTSFMAESTPWLLLIDQGTRMVLTH